MKNKEFLKSLTALTAQLRQIIKAELEFNPRLKTDFAKAVGQGRVWQADCYVSTLHRHK